MAATERVVVLLTPEQKKLVARRARAEKLSLSDYMRRQALGDDEVLAGLLSELRLSTARALEALDSTLARLEQAHTSQAEVEAQARRRARTEFADIDVDAFARLLRPDREDLREGQRQSQGAT